MQKAKRKLRTYKTFDNIYNPAKKAAGRYDITLCRAIELFQKELAKSKNGIITINLTDHK